MDIRNHHVGVDCQLGLKGGKVSNDYKKVKERTLKTWRILLRSSLQVAIVSLSFFAWKSREAAFRLPRLTMFFWISATVLPLRAWSERTAQRMRRWLNSRSQLSNPLEHWLTEFIRPSPVHSPVEGPTNVGAGQPEIDIVHFVDHRVLYTSACGEPTRTRGKPTLTIVRITLTEPRAALAGVMLNTSFAIFMASIAAIKEERVVS